MKTSLSIAACLVLSARFAAAQDAVPDQVAAGKMVYMTVCFACHQPTGLGLPPVFPPLTKSEYVAGSPERFAAMILKGNAGPMTIEGKPYNNIMPGQELMLTDDKIAAVMTFVRSSFGNSAPAVPASVVAAARAKFAERKTPWTEAELKAWKDDAAPAK
ncbi:MAG: cytochrome oxidase Cbb3 [Chthoniobacteraceae bacterium]|nr:cytochrome oxidase Cbb3 [Chthoniobacteraceae bacterium]